MKHEESGAVNRAGQMFRSFVIGIVGCFNSQMSATNVFSEVEYILTFPETARICI